MTDIVREKTQISVVNPGKAEIDNGIAAAATEAGQPLYIDANGKYALADGNGSGTTQFRGIALETVAAGQPISVLVRGELYGYTLAGAYDSAAYVSNTVGEIGDSAGGTSLVVGRVVGIFNSKGTGAKVLKVTGWAG